jgi:hypothetical protein
VLTIFARFWDRINKMLYEMDRKVSLRNREVQVDTFVAVLHHEKFDLFNLLDEISIWTYRVYRQCHTQVDKRIEIALWKLVNLCFDKTQYSYLGNNLLLKARSDILTIAKEIENQISTTPIIGDQSGPEVHGRFATE